ncbi:hypothetical protein L226DRAFT_547187 [Lentinus tigrinus ALCF2SS1-7]|uniref:F-box domain-containing protein n=1 Tax=Lentinus tigrinus ALCF2SS1-6 TaxID=1328759 RepID=A0A5C2S0N7_9APHY|nr:hypothetical protein L227DRAFT_587823 [Lentinus tigrinus ALCF2SS1-6]RPD71734.1 hypothetical protein L226DRAFT_547187 [Lentinus tigrinus ALCF2SS1-7]
MYLSRIPPEILRAILAFALDHHPCPCDMLCVNKTFLELGQLVLHGQLHFRSINQLILFGKGRAPLVCPPRTVVIALAGGSADSEVFRHLMGALKRCQRSHATAGGRNALDGHTSNGNSETAKVTLDILALRLHSHSSKPHLGHIKQALSMVNPKTFIFRGPELEHNFSTAIDSMATHHVLWAMSTWTIVRHVTLTNLCFPSDELGLNTLFSHGAPLLPPLPTLHALYISQATLLPPTGIAAMIAGQDHEALECVHLVDAYRHSVWGNQIRLRDVEDAVLQLRTMGPKERVEALEHVRGVVICETTEGA